MATPNTFKKGDKVTVTKRNGETLTGVISACDMNYCTFKTEYCVDYQKDGKTCTLMCVPQTAITLNA